MTIKSYGRSAAALAAAGALLALPTILLPAADAAPVSALVHAQSQRQSESTLAGTGLTLDLHQAIDLDAQGIAVKAVDGARMDDSAVILPVDKGSKITYGKKVTGGTVRLQGGIQLSKGEKKLTISNVAYDLETGALRGKFGSQPNIRFATIRHPDSAAIVLEDNSTIATLKLAAGDGIELSADFFAALDKALGTTLSSDMDVSTGIDIDATLDVDVDLANGKELNADLITALGLDDSIDASAGVDGLLDLNVDIDLL
ncbi:hypothetical protein [Nocardia suismassiliense]|uniref:hypothetical protein n=1 Tax=Nocardia suismassiliense TaxID=2077092 RepID=UPI00131F1A53|nr:hypothetical protein [Nocardia suismassiliense]